MKFKEPFGMQVFSLSTHVLDHAYTCYQNQDPEKCGIIKKIADFKRLRDYHAESIATNKLIVPPSGNVHDFYSQGPYWFPDPDKPDGLPYINKDGNINPEADDEFCDKNRKKRMFSNIYALTTLFFFTRDEAYGEKAAILLRHWFINSSTVMNPNVNYGQAIPGICTGRDAGIIEFHFLIQIIDAVTMIRESSYWNDEDDQVIKSWMIRFIGWLRTSKIGLDESRITNNHGSWYVSLLMKLAAWCGQDEIVRECIELIKARIVKQLLPDGTLPLELKRTQPWDYSIFGLSGFLVSATIALEYGEDLFNYRSSGGISIRNSVDYLSEFASGSKTWSYPELYGFVPEKLTPILHIAAFYYDDDSYLDVINAIPIYDDLAGRLFFYK